MSNIVVTGADSGLGFAIARELDKAHKVTRYDLANGHDVVQPARIWPARVDVLINCAGVNRIDWLAQIHEEDWDRVMDTNAKGIMRMAQALHPLLYASSGTILNIVSNASHMPMRCSLAYNASKAAAHMMTLQLARELSPRITVFGISPNKLKGTGMSDKIEQQVMRTRGWTKKEADAYQKQSLLCGEETTVDAVAEFIGFLLATKERHKYLTGCVVPYGA